jgi:hypothetical protein
MGVAAPCFDGRDVYLLRIAKPDDLEHVREFLRTRRVRLRVVEGKVRVESPAARTPLHERRELIGCVAAWNALNPGSPVELVAPDEGS